MKASAIFSTANQLEELISLLVKYARLPFFTDTIPGAVMEAALAKVRQAEVLKTYDFIDVIDRDRQIGWQVKSTKASTPVTWKRAKLPNQRNLIEVSMESPEGLQSLGDTIIDFCNHHVEQSFRLYNLREIGYSRLIVFDDGRVIYFERFLCDQGDPKIFKREEFEWHWTVPKKTVKKEQLPALHGYHKASAKKWFAWHGLGENQLHFSGETDWWIPIGEPHTAAFSLPSLDEKIDLETLMDVLTKLKETD